MQKVILTLLFCIVTPPLAYAESLDSEAAGPFSGNVALGGYKTTGNSNVATYEGNLKLKYTYEKWLAKLTFEGTQTVDGNVVTSDYADTILRGEYNLPNNVYALLQLGYRRDYFSGIIHERSYVLGVGYHAFTDVPDFSLDLEIGQGERVSKKVNVIKIDHDPGTHLALFGRYEVTESDAIAFEVSGELGNDDDYIKKKIAWVHDLFAGLNLELNFESRRTTRPEIGKVAQDDTFTTKLGYEF